MSGRRPDAPGDERREAEGFVARWSRRKSGARQDAEPVQSPPVALGPSNGAPDGTSMGATEDKARSATPDLGELDQDSDYSAFLSPGVDEGLRRQALRKLFSSPKFNTCDGLDDYCGDLTKFAPLGGIITADMRHRMQHLARNSSPQPTVTEPPPVHDAASTDDEEGRLTGPAADRAIDASESDDPEQLA
jgi:hypothetical protein